MQSIVWSGLLGLKLSTVVVTSAVFQVFSGYETINACWDWRGTDRRVITLRWSSQMCLLFESLVVGMETVVAIVTVVVYISIVVILL